MQVGIQANQLQTEIGLFMLIPEESKLKAAQNRLKAHPYELVFDIWSR